MSVLDSVDVPLELIKRKIDGIKDFLRISLSIANAHTVDFYTHNVWDEYIAVPPASVLSMISASRVQEMAPESQKNQSRTTTAGTDEGSFGFCDDSNRLVDVTALLDAAKRHALPGLGVCVPLPTLLQTLREHDAVPPIEEDVRLEPEEFMNSKKSHEVQVMSEVVASLARYCRAQQVIDVGSGKGYLCSFLSLQYGLKVYGIDSSSTNTHGAQERNRKLKKYSRAYQRHGKGRSEVAGVETQQSQGGEEEEEQRQREGTAGIGPCRDQDAEPPPVLSAMAPADSPVAMAPGYPPVQAGPDPESPFLGFLSPELVELPPPRVPPSELSGEERERRKRENLERKAQGTRDSALYSPLTSYVTAETELREIITELEDAVVVGLHTCGDLAPSTLRMFTAKPELRAACSVGCCYHLLSEEFDRTGPAVVWRRGASLIYDIWQPAGIWQQECPSGVWGFPMSQHLRGQAWLCGRNARMSACLALERVTVGQGLPTESLFYRAVLHVILRDHYGAIKSERRVGNVYSKSTSFVDYVRRALGKLGLDGSKISDGLVQEYHDKYRPRMQEMEAFNTLKVILAPCIEGLLLLDRLCYLKEQDDTCFSALVQLFDPLTSPRCYGIIGLKKSRT